jgi:hypothetical protein
MGVEGMKCTLKFLRVTAIVLLVIIMLLGYIIGGYAAVLAVLGILVECNFGFIIFLPVGFIGGVIGSVAADVTNYFMERWFNV